MITEQHQQAIREMVEQYVTARGLISQGARLQVTLTLVPTEPIVSVIDKTIGYDPAVLSLNAADSFREFCVQKRQKRRLTLETLKSSRFEEDYSIRGLVSLYSDYSREYRDQQWLTFRNIGRNSLREIDEWLTSLGLHRGMKL